MASIPHATYSLFVFIHTVPAVPHDLHVLAVSDSVVNLTWQPPASDGGTPITHYIIEIVHSDTQLNFTTGKTSLRVSNLRKGEHYQISVKAMNAVGPSTSVQSSVTTFDGELSYIIVVMPRVGYTKSYT